MIKCARCEVEFLNKNEYIEHEEKCERKEKIIKIAEKAFKRHEKAFRKLAEND